MAKTAIRVLDIVKKHVKGDPLKNIVRELQDVPGDKDFREAVINLSIETQGGQ